MTCIDGGYGLLFNVPTVSVRKVVNTNSFASIQLEMAVLTDLHQLNWMVKSTWEKKKSIIFTPFHYIELSMLLLAFVNCFLFAIALWTQLITNSARDFHSLWRSMHGGCVNIISHVLDFANYFIAFCLQIQNIINGIEMTNINRILLSFKKQKPQFNWFI